ncbi:MAG: ATP-binding protein [Candidatus Dormibacteraeota bacterium]|nr:ATP-binding protein [Candidatus Dormibacteraeota bacterium]
MGHVTELRLPAEREYAVVAKRTAAAVGSVAGFDMDAVDDLTIAVSQAFDNAISCLERSGYLTGQVRMAFKQSQRGVEINVRSTVNREAELAARVQREAMLVQAAAEQQREEEAAAVDLALRLMGLFVDRSSYRVDERTGGLQVRLTKYRVA